MNGNDRRIIYSYGCLLYHRDKEGIHWMFSRRKESISLVCLLKNARGMKPETFWFYVGNMTKTEYFLLVSYDVEQLVCEFSIRSTFSNANKIRANVQFIKERLDPEKIQGLSDIWEFPKGRPIGTETGHQTALRELKEETGIDSRLLSAPICEIDDVYTGLNRLLYGTRLYVMECTEKVKPEQVYENHIRFNSISNEVSEVKWVSDTELQNMICKKRYKEFIDTVKQYIYRRILPLTAHRAISIS